MPTDIGRFHPEPTHADLVEAAAVGIVAVDTDGQIVSVNAAASRMLGWFETEIVGRQLRTVVKDVDDDESRAFGHAVLRLMHLDDDVFRRRDGSLLPVWWASTPLRVAERNAVVGAVVVFGDTTVRRARAAADAAERAQGQADLAAARSDVAQLEWVGRVTQALSSTLEEDEVLRRLANLVAGTVADICLTDLIEEDGVLRRVGIAADDRLVDAAALGPFMKTQFEPQSASYRAVIAAEILHVPRERMADPELLSPQTRELLRSVGAVDMLAIAMTARGHVNGAVAFIRVGDSPPFDELQRLVALDVARRAALALDNARLFHTQTDISQRLQRALLPRLPQRLSVRAAVRYLPARDRFDVGGDWYDVFRCPDDSETAVLVIGDVAGHDLQAGTTMSAVRNLLRGIAVATNDTPDGVIDAVDRNLDALGIGGTATIAMMTVSPNDDGTWSVAWTNAGHMPPLLFTPDRTVEVLEDVHGPLVGTHLPTRRALGQRTVPGGTTIVLYTDGLVEVREQNIDLGLARLRRTAMTVSADLDDPEALADELLAMNHVSSEDDTAMLVCHLPVRS